MKRTVLAALSTVLLAAPLTLAACGSTSEEPAAGGDPCKDTTLTFIGLKEEVGDGELKEWREERGMDLASSWPGDWAQLIAAIKVGQPYDLSTIPYHWAQRMIAAKIVQPIDTSRLTNWDKLAPGLRDSASLRGEDGQVYGVPIAWGDAPFVYSPERVAEPPASIKDLLDPSWNDRFVMFDSPDLPFHLLAKANGFDESPLLTPEQLDVVVDEAQVLVDNAAAFNSNYQDANDRLIAEDADLAIGGWEAQLTWANEKGVTLDFGFFEEGKHGWWDGLAIPSTATNVDCAYEYIDEMISVDTKVQIANNLVSGAVNTEAFEKVGEEAKIYDYEVVSGTGTKADDFAASVPPETVPDGYVNYQAWLDAWQQIKS